MANDKLGSIYFSVKNGEEWETTYLGALFENQWDPADPRKSVSLSVRGKDDKFYRATKVTYADGTEIDLGEKTYIKMKFAPGQSGAAEGGAPPANDAKPGRF
jgi:hypothetical protein